MASVLNRTTKEFRPTANTPDYPVISWIINPDMSAVAGFPSKYWKITGDIVSLMSAAEQAQVDLDEFLLTASTSAAFQIGAFGDGVDGIVTIAVDSSLAQDKYFQQLTISSGVTVSPSGFRTFASEYIVNNGTVQINGGDAVGATAGAAAAAGTLRGGAIGAAGGIGAGLPGTSLTTGAAPGAGGAGGAGGSGSGGGGGAGGQVPVGTAFRVRPRRAFGFFDTGDEDQAQASLYAMFAGGAGGGSGGGGGSGKSSGGGGGGAGIMVIGTPGLVNNGTIRANGGVGGAGNATGNTGGGGGGGGGLVGIGRLYRMGSGTVTVSGGLGGALGGTGTVGAAGAAGRIADFNMNRG